MRRTAVLALMGFGLLAGCASETSPPGYAAVHLSTSPVDGDCELKGKGFMLATKTPAEVLVPVGAAPLDVTCVKIGYKGSGVLSSSYDPWSPANVGTLGLGYLVDRDSPSSRGLPAQFRVSMTYAEAGTAADVAIMNAAREAEIPKPEATGTPGPVAQEDMKAGAGMPKKPATAAASTGDAGLPAPPAVAGTASETADGPTRLAPGSKESAPKKPAAAPLKLAAADAVKVHLTSFQRKDHAERSWRNLVKEFPKALGDKKPIIEQVDLGAKGKYYRVYAGPLEDAKAARDLCFELSQKKVYCRPVSKGGK